MPRYPFSAVIAIVVALPLGAGAAEVPGLPNLQQVNQQVYRGAQPFNSGWARLAKMGVTTVVDLRRDNEDGEHSIREERKLVEAAGMRYVSIPMDGIVAPSTDQISKALSVLNSGERVFVHCKKGKDRTGTVIAVYRMTHDGWNNEKAYKEAKNFGLHWYEVGMKQYIKSFRAPLQLAGGAELDGAVARP